MGCSCRGFIRFMSMRAFEGIIIVLLILYIPNLPPHCKIQKPYKVEPTKPFEGALALNEKLDNVRFWHEGDFKGPEAFAVYNGELYTSLHSGDIVKLTGDKHITPVVRFGKPCKNEFEEKECGRPLGLAFDKDGFLYAADAYYGIFKVNVKTGDKEQLISPDDEIDGEKSKVFNSVVVSSSGDVYFTVSSTEFLLLDGLFDLLADGTGRLIHYNPKTKKTQVLMSSIHFANGLILSENEDYLLLSETGRSQVHKYHLKGAKAGSSEIFINGLPGLPDNVNYDGEGGYLLPLISSHDAANPSPVQIFGPFPLIRHFISRVMGLFELTFNTIERVYPNEYTKMGAYFIGHFSSAKLIQNSRTTIIRVNAKGEIIDSFHTTKGDLKSVSEAFIYKNNLLLGSPFETRIGLVPLKDLGLSTHKEKREIKQEAPQVKATEAPKIKPTEAPKVKATEAPKVKATEAPKVKATEPPKVKATEAPKVKATEAPKVKATEAPKVKATEAPKVKATEAPKAKPTEAPKVKATQPPKVKATEPPKAKATEAPKPKPTEAPKVKTTEAPKVKPTEKKATEAPKPKTAPPPTEAPKKVKTDEKPKAKPVDAPKPKPTEAPKAKPESPKPEKTKTPDASKPKYNTDAKEKVAASQENIKKT